MIEKPEGVRSRADLLKSRRREFLKATSTLVAGAMFAPMLASPARSAEPKRGGFARFALSHGATTDTLDPGSWADTFGQTAFYGTIFNGLVEIETGGNVTGDLAEQFGSDDGGKTWRVQLRPELKFHDDRPVTSRDVIASIEYHRTPDSRSSVKPLLEVVDAIEADGEGVVIFKLNQAYLDFPYILADQHFVILPATADGTIDWAKGIGTGPFVLESFRPGISVIGVRNSNYHKPGKPYFDKVEFLPILDAATRATALLSGEVHYIASPDLKTLALLQRNPSVKVLNSTGLGHYTFPMNVTMAPFDDPNVRLALKYAMDREEILKKVFLGYGAVGNDNPIAPSMKFAINPEPLHTYNPDLARQCLEKSGLDRLSVPLHVSDAAFAGAVDSALLYKESAKNAGIDINVIREPADGYWDNVWMKRPWFASFWSGRATIDAMFSLSAGPTAPWNETRWSNDRFDELLIAARSETDETKRAQMYAEAQTIQHEEGGNLVVIFSNFVSVYSDTLVHGDVATHWEHDGFRIAERWWFA